MRRRRIPLNAATPLSLLLCVASVVLWIRSYQVAYGLDWWPDDTMHHLLHAERGRLRYTFLPARHP